MTQGMHDDALPCLDPKSYSSKSAILALRASGGCWVPPQRSKSNTTTLKKLLVVTLDFPTGLPQAREPHTARDLVRYGV